MTTDPNTLDRYGYPHDALDIAGIDLSLRATGVATRRGTTTIKPHDPVKTGPRRLLYLRDAILYAIRVPMLAVVEGYSYASPNQGPQMGELGGVLKVALHEAGIPYVVVAPTSVKKYATGKGNATKGQVLGAAIMRAGEDFDGDDNQADAWWLRQMGLAYYNDIDEWVKLPAAQSEVLTRIDWPEL